MNLREQLGSITISIIGGGIAVIIMVFFPIIIMAEQTDETIKLQVQAATEELLNEIITTGLFTQEQLDNFQLTLDATEFDYDVEITIVRIDGNPAKKTTGDTSVDSTTTYTKYTTQVLEDLANNGVVILNEGDFIYIKVTRNGESWLEIFCYVITGNPTYGEASGMATKSGE